jgi:hypothetical protein
VEVIDMSEENDEVLEPIPCPRCGREFYDYSDYRMLLRLEQHLKDKHKFEVRLVK